METTIYWFFSSYVWGNIVSKKKDKPSLSLETIIHLATISDCDIALLNRLSYKAMTFIIRSDHLPTLPFLNSNNGCDSVLAGWPFCSWTCIIAVNFNIFRCIYKVAYFMQESLLFADIHRRMVNRKWLPEISF